MTARSESFSVQVEDQSTDLTVTDTNDNSYSFPCLKCKEFWKNLNSSINVGFNRSIEKVKTGFENCYKKFYNDREWKKLWKIIQRFLLEDFGQPSSNSKTVSVRQFISMIKHFGCVGAENQDTDNSFFMKQVERLLKHSSVKRGKAKLSWFGGHMTKQEADEKLSNEPCGTFLVRFCESEMDNGGFAFAVKATDDVNHYVVMSQTCCDSSEYNGKLLLYKDGSPDPGEITYPDLVTFVNERLKANEVDNIRCTSVCPGLRYNADFTGYK